MGLKYVNGETPEPDEAIVVKKSVVKKTAKVTKPEKEEDKPVVKKTAKKSK